MIHTDGRQSIANAPGTPELNGAVLLDGADEKEAVLGAILAGLLEESLRVRMALTALATDPGSPHAAAEKALAILDAKESLLPPPSLFPESDPGDEQTE